MLDRKYSGLKIAVWILLGFFFGLAAGDATDLEGWLLKWQTLIAGGLAIVAAAITVVQMQVTDDRQEDRHSDLMSLGLRADRLRITRYRDLRRATLIQIAESFKRTVPIIGAARGRQGDEVPEILTEAFLEFMNASRNIEDELADILLDEAKPLLDSRSFLLLENLKESTEIARRGFVPLLNVCGMPSNVLQTNAEEWVGQQWKLISRVGIDVAAYADDLDRIVDLYDLRRKKHPVHSAAS